MRGTGTSGRERRGARSVFVGRFSRSSLAEPRYRGSRNLKFIPLLSEKVRQLFDIGWRIDQTLKSLIVALKNAATQSCETRFGLTGDTASDKGIRIIIEGKPMVTHQHKKIEPIPGLGSGG